MSGSRSRGDVAVRARRWGLSLVQGIGWVAPLVVGAGWIARLVGVVALVAAVTVGGAGAARAHTELESSDPAAGAHLQRPPEEIRLVFAGPVSAQQATIDINGHDLKARAADRATELVAEVRGTDVPAGPATVRWRTAGVDGHPLTGVIKFQIAKPAPPPQDKGAGTTGGGSGAAQGAWGGVGDGPGAVVAYGTSVARIAGYLGLAVFAGGLVFVAVLWPRGSTDRRTRSLLGGAWALGTAGTLAGLLLHGPYVTQRPLTEALDPAIVDGTLGGTLGQVWAAKALLWMLAAVVLAWALQYGPRAVRSVSWRVAALATGIGLIRTTGMTAHATETARPFLSEAADFVHLAGVAAWLGGLTVLLACLLPRRDAAELGAVVPGFSRLAFGSVVVISLAGAVLAWQLVGTPDALFTTAYGRLLTVKLAAFALVLLAARRSKAWVAARLPTLRTGDGAALRPFGRSVAAELVFALVVLFAAGLLVTAAPGR